MAEPAARDELSAGFLRRHPGQDPRRGPGPQQGRLSRAWRRSRWTKDILGLWIETTEGAKFWLKVMNDLKARGVEDILIAVVDGLRGFPEAIEAVFPQAAVQTCIVHLIRNSLDFVSWKDRKPVVAELENLPRRRRRGRPQGPSGLRGRLMGPQICGDRPIWRRQWKQFMPFFALLRPCANHLHHECYRGLERQAATGRAGERPFPQRRGGDQAHFPGLAPGRSAMENAAPRMGRG